jgi:hypothetical protein
MILVAWASLALWQGKITYTDMFIAPLIKEQYVLRKATRELIAGDHRTLRYIQPDWGRKGDGHWRWEYGMYSSSAFWTPEPMFTVFAYELTGEDFWFKQIEAMNLQQDAENPTVSARRVDGRMLILSE